MECCICKAIHSVPYRVHFYPCILLGLHFEYTHGSPSYRLPLSGLSELNASSPPYHPCPVLTPILWCRGSNCSCIQREVTRFALFLSFIYILLHRGAKKKKSSHLPQTRVLSCCRSLSIVRFALHIDPAFDSFHGCTEYAAYSGRSSRLVLLTLLQFLQPLTFRVRRIVHILQR